jgi:hypothetical protein
VSTALTSKPGAVSRRRSVGIPNSGVPQKTTRIGAGPCALPLTGLPQFADFSPDQVALQHAQMLDEKDAAQVIDLVA